MTDPDKPEPFTLLVNHACAEVPSVRERVIGWSAQGARVLVTTTEGGPMIPLWQWLMQRKGCAA